VDARRAGDVLRLDSDILIDHLRGYEPARQYLKRFEAGEMQGYLSIITVAELAAGQMRQAQEEEKIHRLLALFTPLALDFTMAWRGGEIRRQYHTRMADALIAATALIRHLPLSTRNLQHFTLIKGLRVEKPYD
jgi:predicted nucleic acid-binding protein